MGAVALATLLPILLGGCGQLPRYAFDHPTATAAMREGDERDCRKLVADERAPSNGTSLESSGSNAEDSPRQTDPTWTNTRYELEREIVELPLAIARYIYDSIRWEYERIEVAVYDCMFRRGYDARKIQYRGPARWIAK